MASPRSNHSVDQEDNQSLASGDTDLYNDPNLDVAGEMTGYYSKAINYRMKEMQTYMVEGTTIGGLFLALLLKGALGIAKIGLATLGLVPVFMLASWRNAWFAWKQYQLIKDNQVALRVDRFHQHLVETEAQAEQEVAYMLAAARREVVGGVVEASLATVVGVPFFLATLVGVGVAMSAVTAALMVAVPWILFGGLIAKAIYHFKAAWDDWQQARLLFSENEAQKEVRLDRAKENVVGGVSLLLMAGAVLATLILSGPFGWAALGIAGAVGLGYVAYRMYKKVREGKRELAALSDNSHPTAPQEDGNMHQPSFSAEFDVDVVPIRNPHQTPRVSGMRPSGWVGDSENGDDKDDEQSVSSTHAIADRLGSSSGTPHEPAGDLPQQQGRLSLLSPGQVTPGSPRLFGTTTTKRFTADDPSAPFHDSLLQNH